MNQNQQSKASKITEGLKSSDLKDMIDGIFTVDQYQSKMGDDKDVMVLRFRAADKEPAIDLMEFIEKGYPFVLDADRSSGEERDGSYSVFVELERNEKSPGAVKDLLSGMSQLCDIKTWRFRWYREHQATEFSVESFTELVPLTKEAYEMKSQSSDQTEIIEFFDQGAINDITLEEGIVTFKKPFAGALSAKLVAVGEYKVLKHVLKGAIQLDEMSRSQMSYLNKYLGNYDINKIENHFLIRNGDRAVILSKEIW